MEALKGIFGNNTAAWVLLYLYHYSEGHVGAITKDLNLHATPVKNQLNRFENAGILISKQVGRARVYFFNPKSPFIKPIKDMLALVHQAMPVTEKERIFSTHKKPRRKGKPIYART